MTDINTTDEPSGVVASTEATGGVTAKVLTESEKLDAQIADLLRKREAVKATENLKAQFDGIETGDQYSMDGALLRAGGAAMEARLRAGQFPDWHTSSADAIVSRAKAELDAGHFVDAAILALMAKAHESLTARKAALLLPN